MHFCICLFLSFQMIFLTVSFQLTFNYTAVKTFEAGQLNTAHTRTNNFPFSLYPLRFHFMLYVPLQMLPHYILSSMCLLSRGLSEDHNLRRVPSISLPVQYHVTYRRLIFVLDQAEDSSNIRVTLSLSYTNMNSGPEACLKIWWPRHKLKLTFQRHAPPTLQKEQSRQPLDGPHSGSG